MTDTQTAPMRSLTSPSPQYNPAPGGAESLPKPRTTAIGLTGPLEV